ncbi:MAG: PilZ domain-containing protein [Acidobacteria bacterium]|nr:PilZ domain-containing protein [Acidobacteriota bacterium]MBV9483211.1 PilZ domain-containing protein [Acidobacteriota bacterium]
MAYHNPDLHPPTEPEQRRWPRLPLAIPVFVRGRDFEDKEFVEFSVMLNESAGGALVAIRRSLRPASRITLEIPSAPLPVARNLPEAVRKVRARVVRITPLNSWKLCGLVFSRPIVAAAAKDAN